ncbi:ATP-binding protein [Acidobacteria bacterium AH-259-D05]|nr:ATP-binding protein [Acidobacteria bacterium AH-259-D05]
MIGQKTINFLLFLVLILLGSAESFFIYNETLRFSEAWFLLLLVFLGFIGLVIRRQDPIVAVLCLLLASLSVLLSGVTPEELLLLEGWLATFGSLFWSSLSLLFPFVFVHFSLAFPITSQWIERRPHRLIALYLPYAVLLVFRDLITETADQVILFIFLLAFVLGLGIFMRQYFFALTTAEKNRLRVIFIGCLAGSVPYVLSLIGEPYLPLILEQLAYFLLPLFPASLVLAVLQENFFEIGRGLQRFLVYSLVGAGGVTGFFLSYIALSFFSVEEVEFGPQALLISLTLSLILIYPLRGWAQVYVSAHFYAPAAGDWKAGDVVPEFHPIRPNPYIVGNPVRSPEMFFGRQEEFQFIRRTLENQQQGCVFVLCGERRTGKTSILYQILNRRLGPTFIPAFVDMQGLVVQKDEELLQELVSRIANAVAEEQNSSELTSIQPVTSYLGFTGFMDVIARQTSGRRLVLLIDEYELIADKVQAGKLSAEVYHYLNSLLERYPRLSFVFTGSRELEPNSGWSHLLGKSFYRKITFLGRKDAEELICRPLQSKVFFRGGVVGDILRLTQGHPFYTQLFCQSMVDVANESQNNIVDQKMLREVVQRVLENPPPQLFYQWAAFSHAEKLLLSALATVLKTAERYVSSERLDRVIRSVPEEHRQQLDITQTRMHLEGMRQCSLLDRDQTRYRFSMDLLRLWIQVEHNVWNVLKEIADSEKQSMPQP